MRQWPLIILALVFAWSAVSIGLRRAEDVPAGTTVLRIGHWQLETGVREAFEKLGKEFAKRPEVQAKYGRVMVVPDAIPDSTYGQWLTSQVMGETAPDIMEVGGLPDPIILSYESRYFLPLTDMAESPNPFNKGTAMEGVPLKETFQDGMRSGYQEELQAFVKVPLSRFTSRVFYNKTLLRKLTGLEEPPRDLRKFFDVCQRIHEQCLPAPNGDQHYSAIASSQWHVSHWYGNVAEPMTFANIFTGDFSRDGYVGTDETFAGIASGRMRLTDLPWRARFELTRKLDEQFNRGFAGLGRDEALFLFAQEKAVFISTGIWDVASLLAQAQGKFEVGIADFPQPRPEDPDYGKLALGPLFDPAWAAFPFAVYRLSPHAELAKDFLRYLASVHGNQELNETIGWIPSISDVPLPPALAKFAPVDQGIYAAGNLQLGGETVTLFNQLFSKYQTDPGYSLAAFVHDLTHAYLTKGKSDWQEQERDWRRAVLGNEQLLAGMRGEALLDRGGVDGGRWVAYRAFTTQRQVMMDIEHREQEELMEKGPMRPVAPYDYLPEALARARRDLGEAGGSADGGAGAEDGGKK